jgi:archaemetzincin
MRVTLFLLVACSISVLLLACRPKEVKSNAPAKLAIHKHDGKTAIALLFFNNSDKAHQSYIAAEIEKFYNCQVTILPSTNLPRGAYFPPRNRYRADTIIAYLKRVKPSAYKKVIGFTNQDVSVRKGSATDWGVFGLGYRPGPSCVVSSYRLRRNNPSQQLLRERLTKVSLHELGHTMGVPHCTSGSESCFMRDAKGKLTTVDKTRKFMCATCRSHATL